MIEILKKISEMVEDEEAKKLIDKAIKMCRECEKAQREYERTLVEEGRRAVAMMEDEVRFWRERCRDVES